MDINYELYKVFYYVARTLSFSEASKCLFISQSAVSQSVKAGDVLVVLEAMKMEIEVSAPVDGTVKAVSAVVGTAVNTDDLLVTLG